MPTPPAYDRCSRPARCLVAVAACWALLGCGDRPASDPLDASPRRGGTAVLGSISDVDNWNEYLSRQTFANSLQRRIFLRLARESTTDLAKPPSFEPELAESWETAPDGLAVTFRLRDAQWSDGRPIRASDVRFTWQAQTSNDVAWSNRTSKEHITDVEVEDERTVTFHFDRVYPYRMTDAVEGGILPEHVFGRIPFSEWRSYDWSTLRVGSGPFLLESYRPADEIVLTRNPRYFREDLPRLNRVVVRIVPDAGNLVTQLMAGALDYTENVPPADAARIRSHRDLTLIPFDEPRYDYIGWNGARPPFDDPVVRRALTLAIDRRALVEEMLYGFGRVSVGPVLSFTWGADRDIEPWPYDPDEATRLLASRGFTPRASDGILERDGRPLELSLTTNAGNRLRETMLVKIQAQLARIGVRVHVRPLEFGTFVNQNMSGEFDAYLGGWRQSGRVLKELFGSDFRPPQGNNVVAYASAEVDGWLEELDGARTWEEMRPVLSRLQRRIHEDLPYTFLYEVRRLAGVGSRLRGVSIDVPVDSLAHLEGDWIAP